MKNKLIFIAVAFVLSACNQVTEGENTNSDEVTIASEKKLSGFDFTYPDLHGKQISLSDYRGKWVVVNFWATWCKPCRKEIPDFVKFKSMYKDKVEILGIDYEDTDLDIVQNFVLEYNVNYPILRADVYNPSEFENKNSRGLPTTVIFNPDGEEVNKRVGPVHFEDLVEMVGI